MYRAKRAALSPKVKRRVGKYELGRTIGEGTFAKVRFAKNTENGDPVAIKILDKEKVQRHRLVEQVSIRQFLSIRPCTSFLSNLLSVHIMIHRSNFH